MRESLVYMLSLGCAKNIVDSEVMQGALAAADFAMTDNPAEADAIVINTCGFIEAARAESIEMILELAAWKTQGRCRVLAAVGCMAEKYADEMLESMPELDVVFGSRDYCQIAQALAEKLALALPKAVLPPAADPYQLRVLPHTATAYLKIAEGCDNACAFCLIPQLRGAYCSRKREDILAEAERLAAAGVKELVLIAQDTSCYGWDLYGENRLPQLLESLAALPFAMIRLLYFYPDGISDDLLRVMAAHENICPYLDLPVQHGVDTVLAAMNRDTTQAEMLQAISAIRAVLPEFALRCTVMVGFPGETEADFAALLDFLRAAQFDWLGAFAYSREEDTPAADFPAQVLEETKEQRLEAVMRLAAEITAKRRARLVGKTLSVLVEGRAEEIGDSWYLGRSAYEAPEVDGMIYFQSEKALAIGELVPVCITDSEIYDLLGKAEDAVCKQNA